jgi:hypothetical protein
MTSFGTYFCNMFVVGHCLIALYIAAFDFTSNKLSIKVPNSVFFPTFKFFTQVLKLKFDYSNSIILCIISSDCSKPDVPLI